MVAEDVAAVAAAPSAMVDFIAGTAGGIASLLAGHPFDTVKTRLQAQPPSLAPSVLASSSTIPNYHAASTTLHAAPRPASVPIYHSAADAFRIIIKEERFLGLYKGVTSPLLGVAIMNASIFGLYNLSLRYQQQHGLFVTSPITQAFLAGMLSGLGSSLITSPIELIKIREQMNTTSSTRTRPSTWKVFTEVLRTEGLFRGVYRGWCTTAMRDLGYGPYFASYELLNLTIRSYSGREELSNLDMAFSGALAGVVAWVSTFWADVVKTKIQASTRFDDECRAGGAKKHGQFWSTASQTYAQGGWRAFFVGVGPTILRALPVNAVLFVTYEGVKGYLIRSGY